MMFTRSRSPFVLWLAASCLIGVAVGFLVAALDARAPERTLGVPAPALQQRGAAQTAAPAPAFVVDPSWPTVPNGWVLGEVTSVSVDSRDHIWVLHVPQSIPAAQRGNAAPPVLEFDQSGKLLSSWGAPADGSPWPGREHGIFVDDENYVWIGGRAGWPKPAANGVSDDMIVKYTTSGKFVMQIGKSGESKGNLDTENVHQATDVFVDTRAKEVYAADGYGNKRVVVFDSETGKFKRMWGAFGNPPPATFGANAPGPQPQTTEEGPPEFGLPHAIKVSRDGIVYVADRINNRMQLFTREGKFTRQVRVTGDGSATAPVPAGFAFSPDAEQRYLYVVDSGLMRVVIFERATMKQIGAVGMRGKGPGEFDIVHHIAVDSKGNLYTAEIVNQRRAQKFIRQ
jgi:DNA-binding beta-propeller fold protein YncE